MPLAARRWGRPEARAALAWIGLRWPALPGLLGLLLGWASYGGGVVDDAYISLLYADNLVSGHGLTFHPALPLTEGYSNLLWTLMLALGLAVGLPGAALAQGLGLICAGATIALVSARVGGARGAAAGLAIAASPIVGYWAGRGLESSLVALLLVVAVTRLGQRSSWLAFGLLGVARVEGVLWGGLGLLHAALVERRLPRPRALALWLVPFGLQLGFRALTYGSLRPAPMLAKISDGVGSSLARGLSWLWEGIDGAPLGALGLAILLFVRAPRSTRDPLAAWAALSALGLVAFGVGVGGDWMPNLRWLMPAVPLTWLALAVAAPSWRPFIPLALLSAVIDAQTGILGKEGGVARRSLRATLETLELGPRPLQIPAATLVVLETLGPDEVVLHPDVGLLAWLTGNPVLDPQGLTWADVAQLLHDGWQEPGSEATLARVQETLVRLRPALVGVPIRGGRSASGPIGALTLGGSAVQPQPWFDAGWERWREEPYGAGGSIRYYLRRDLGEKIGKEARLRRYASALARAPEAEVLATRVAWTLRQLDRDEEARAAEQGIDPRARRIAEIWSR